MEKDQLKVRVLETGGVMEADMAWLLLKPGRIIADRNNKERQREWGRNPNPCSLD